MSDPSQPNQKGSYRRPVRSFVLRTGRITAGQRRALDELWPVYGLESGSDTLDFEATFGRRAPVVLEIGFGNGENLIDMARAAPERDFLGIEVHEPGVGHCMLQAKEHELTNLRVMRADAVEILRRQIANNSLQRVNLFFPDPWHKKRHHKRRIVQPAFVALLANKLLPGGLLHMATDWPNYAEHIAAVMRSTETFEAAQTTPTDRIETRFDKRGQKLGHENWERAWRRCN